MMFNYIDEEHLPNHNGPRLWVGWLKVSPNLPDRHGLQVGFFGATGKDQEAHDGNEDGTEDHWLDGDSSFWGADFVYKYDCPKAHGQGDWIFQGEYLYRKTDLDVVGHDLNPSMVGRSLIKNQDGFYIQGLYGFLPRWRAGLRWEMVGLTNKDQYPPGNSKDFGSSSRYTGMIDWSPSEFSRLRFQTAYGDWDLLGRRKGKILAGLCPGNRQHRHPWCPWVLKDRILQHEGRDSNMNKTLVYRKYLKVLFLALLGKQPFLESRSGREAEHRNDHHGSGFHRQAYRRGSMPW
jgi:hypothetical protein